MLPEVWRSEVCAGLDPTHVAKVLALLRGGPDELQRNHRIQGKQLKFYTITASIFSSSNAETPVTPVTAPETGGFSHSDLEDVTVEKSNKNGRVTGVTGVKHTKAVCGDVSKAAGDVSGPNTDQVCAQCKAPNDILSYRSISGKTVLLHEECVRFYRDYLRGRAITLLPPSIRVTAMGDLIAAVQAPNGEIIAVQVTRLTAEGKKADVAVPRITTGSLGFGAVRLGGAGDILGIAEGIETALSAMQIFNIPVWACFGAARMDRVAIPVSVRELHIFGDNDGPGRTAAERTAGIHRARKRVLRFPSKEHKDFNDLLQAKCGRAA